MEKIYKIDLVLVIVSLVVLIVLVGYARPMVIAPLDGYESSGNVLFSIENAGDLLIDDNMEFTTPDRYAVEDGMEINLMPGIYYWKAVGTLSGDVRILTINSEVNLELRRDGEDYSVVNAGNVRLNVDVYNGTDLVDKVKVDVGEGADGGDKYIGGMDDE